MSTPLAPAHGGRVDPPPFEALLQTGATWVLLLGVAWGLLLVAAGVVERLSRGRLPALRWAGCPRRARPLLLALAGLVVLLPGSAGAAQAAGAGAPTDGQAAPGASGQRVAAPGRALPAPSRPNARFASPVPTARAAAAAAAPPQLIVRPGDSLWSLAASHLGPGADPAEVAGLVARLHHRNLEVVGPDPDLLHPGQQLRFPVTPPPQEAP